MPPSHLHLITPSILYNRRLLRTIGSPVSSFQPLCWLLSRCRHFLDPMFSPRPQPRSAEMAAGGRPGELNCRLMGPHPLPMLVTRRRYLAPLQLMESNDNPCVSHEYISSRVFCNYGCLCAATPSDPQPENQQTCSVKAQLRMRGSKATSWSEPNDGLKFFWRTISKYGYHMYYLGHSDTWHLPYLSLTWYLGAYRDTSVPRIPEICWADLRYGSSIL